MSKKVLILSGSPRKNGNSDILCDEFMKGATESGNEVEKIRVAEKKIGFCLGCYACEGTGVCVIKDDMAEVLQKMIDADAELESAETTIACFRGYAECVEGAKEMGIVYGMNAYEKGEIRNSKAMTEAYEMGKQI